jgi:hypothetical protein
LKAAPREDTGQELPVRARQPVGGVPEGKNPSTREAFRAFGDRGINRNLPRQLHIDTINENQARDWYRSPEFRAKDSRGAEELMRRYGAQTGLIPRLLDYEEDKKNRIEDLGDENYTYAGKSVPNFHPRSGNEMPNIVPYSQMHKMTPDEIEQETNALNDWQQRQLDREIEEPEGSTEHYTANHERYEFGEGIPHLAEMASRIAPTSRFRIQGDNMYDSNPEDYQEHEITFPSNKIYTRTPLGMLQTGGIEQLTPEQRDVTKRIRTLLHAHSIQNEENKDSTLLDTAREFYNGLPPEAKGFRERMPEQNRKLAIRNAMTDLTKMTNPKELKAKWNSVFENAVDGGMSDKDLTELRDLYKLRKYELSRGTLEGYEMHRAGIRARSGVSHSGRDVSHTKRQKQEEARWAASRRGTYGELTSRFGTGQKLEFIKQRRLMDRAEKLEGAGRAADYLRVLTGKIQDYKADEAQYKERLDGARGDERADIIKELDSIRQNLRELELRHKYATSARD